MDKPKNIMLSKEIQTKKDKYCIFSLICGFYIQIFKHDYLTQSCHRNQECKKEQWWLYRPENSRTQLTCRGTRETWGVGFKCRHQREMDANREQERRDNYILNGNDIY